MPRGKVPGFEGLHDDDKGKGKGGGGPSTEFGFPGGGGGGGGGGGTSFSYGGNSYSYGGGGGGGGSSGSGGGGGPSEAEQREQTLIRAGESLYFGLWDQPAPPGYIEGLIKGGKNLYELELHERGKPAFRKTKTWQDEAANVAASLLRFLGVSV